MTADRTNSASSGIRFPRTVRRKPWAGDGCGRVFILPHIAIGVWFTFKALLLVLCFTLGSATPGRVVGGQAEPHSSSVTCTVDIVYELNGSERHASREVK